MTKTVEAEKEEGMDQEEAMSLQAEGQRVMTDKLMADSDLYLKSAI